MYIIKLAGATLQKVLCTRNQFQKRGKKKGKKISCSQTFYIKNLYSL